MVAVHWQKPWNYWTNARVWNNQSYMVHCLYKWVSRLFFINCEHILIVHTEETCFSMSSQWIWVTCLSPWLFFQWQRNQKGLLICIVLRYPIHFVFPIITYVLGHSIICLCSCSLIPNLFISPRKNAWKSVLHLAMSTFNRTNKIFFL